jgi:hypothetical protein
MGPPPPPHKIILVHGTGAGCEDDTGDQWWLRGDPAAYPRVVWHRLAARLGPGFECLREGELFHWGGQNSETAREEAGSRLLDLLLAFERQGQPYHLVGHSHGGSVIRAALMEATWRQRHPPFRSLRWLVPALQRRRPRYDLPQLRSWTTVGTPFLRFQPGFRYPWVQIVLFLLLLLTSYWPVHELITYRITPMTAWGGLLGRLVLGGFWAMVALYAAPLLSHALVVDRARRLVQLEPEFAAAFLGRWLPIRSVNDEAIGGLRQGFALRERIVPRVVLDLRWLVRTIRQAIRERRLSESQFSRLTAMLRGALAAPIQNGLVGPIGDRFIWRQLRRRMFGNDRPGLRAAAVMTTPIALDLRGGEDVPALPDRVERTLYRTTTRALARSVGRVREVLGAGAAGGGPGSAAFLRESLTWGELIHTSYFGNEDVLDILCLHIRATGGDVGDRGALDVELVEWYDRTRAIVSEAGARKRRGALRRAYSGMLRIFGRGP